MQVLEAWGDYLSDEKCFDDAATTYLCCSSLEKALKAYRACGNWREVLTVAGLHKMGKDAVLQLAHELREELQALGKPGEAAKIALEYCGDVEGGICLLIDARDWEEALRIAFAFPSLVSVLSLEDKTLFEEGGIDGEAATQAGPDSLGPRKLQIYARKKKKVQLGVKKAEIQQGQWGNLVGIIRLGAECVHLVSSLAPREKNDFIISFVLGYIS